MNDRRKALLEFIDNQEKWLDIKVPADLAVKIESRIKLYRQRKGFLLNILKYATAEAVLMLLLKSLAM
jgi:hypothetical protein